MQSSLRWTRDPSGEILVERMPPPKPPRTLLRLRFWLIRKLAGPRPVMLNLTSCGVTIDREEGLLVNNLFVGHPPAVDNTAAHALLDEVDRAIQHFRRNEPSRVA